MTVTGIWRLGKYVVAARMSAVAAPTNAHIACPSCGAATLVQVIQDDADKFLKEMNSTVLAHHLKALGLIPAIVETNVLQSKSREEANAHLLQHLKDDADMKSVMEIFRIASQEPGYGRMNTLADVVLRKLQQGLYWCVHTHKSYCCCVLLMCRTSVYVCKPSMRNIHTYVRVLKRPEWLGISDISKVCKH